MVGLTVENGVDERRVKAAKQHERFEEEHANRSGQNNNDHLIDVQRFQLIGCNDIAALLAHCLRLSTLR